MNYLEFKNKMFDLECFNIHLAYAWEPGFKMTLEYNTGSFRHP